MKLYDRVLAQWADYRPTEDHGRFAETLESAVVIDVSNVAKYMKANPSASSMLKPSHVPPFTNSWWETSVVHVDGDRSLVGLAGACMSVDFGPLGDAGISEAIETFLEHHPHAGEVGSSLHSHYFDGREPRWILSWCVFLFYKNKIDPIPAYVLTYMLDRQGKIINTDREIDDETIPLCSIITTNFDLPTLRHHDKWTPIAFNMISPFDLAIGFTHCKNVELVDGRQAEGKLRKKQEKRLGRPITTFKELVIDPSMTQTRYEGKSAQPRQHGAKSLHIARGHFATYSEDKPLFGKYSGTFWKPAHVRGSADVGTVGKDYAVKAPRRTA